jgi:hypothetical protein
MQGAQELRSEAHLSRVSRDNDEVEAQRRRWTFCEVIKYEWQRMSRGEKGLTGREDVF